MISLRREFACLTSLCLLSLLAGCANTVPSVIGRQLPDAEARLHQAGFKTKISKDHGFKATNGRVIDQSPGAGEDAKKDSTVLIVVAEGPTLEGTFSLREGISRMTNGECSGMGGYSDVSAGLDVVVKNEKSEVIAIGRLQGGTYRFGGLISRNSYDGVCEFSFSIKNMPKANFYQIEVGRRGVIKYSLGELDGSGWTVDLSLG